MSKMRCLLGLWVSISVGAAVLLPSSAEACSCVDLYAVSPGVDAGSVPTNTWVRITGNVPAEATLQQVVDAGVLAEVPVEVREPTGDGLTRYLVPLEPLTKGAQYVVNVGSEERSRFNVESDPDLTAPTFDGIISAVYDESAPFGPVSSCGPSKFYSLGLAFIEEDQTPPGDFFYNVYAGKSADTVDLTRPAVVLPPGVTSLGQTACGPYFNLDENPQPWVVVTAVDRAGNESEKRRPFQLTTGCGCSASGGNVQVIAVMFLVALWVARRRLRG